MRGLRIIPMFIILIILSYFGMWFVELNRSEVILNLGTRQTPPAALGFVVLTSVLIGMLVAGLFCSIELVVLYMQNRRLKSRLPSVKNPATADTPSLSQEIAPRITGRFT